MYAMSRMGYCPEAFQKKDEKKDVLTVSLTVFAAMGIIVLFFAKEFDQILGLYYFPGFDRYGHFGRYYFYLTKKNQAPGWNRHL